MLSKSELMGVGLKRETYPVLGEKIEVREMSMAELDAYWKLPANDLTAQWTALLKSALVDPEPDDELVEFLLNEADREVFGEVLKACRQINGFKTGDEAPDEQESG